MPLDIKDLVTSRMGDNYELHDLYLNRTLVKVQRTIGFDIVYARAEGAYLYDMDGKDYLDFLSGFGVYNIGRNHPVAQQAIRDILELNLPNMVQLDSALIQALHERGFEIAVETNGTIAAPLGLDWVCVSPKAGAPFVQRSGDELKLVYPQAEADPGEFAQLQFKNFFLQPMDGPSGIANTKLALNYCLEHPQWRLSLQTHKILNIR